MLDFYDFILFFTRWFAFGEGDDDDDDDERNCGFSYAKLTRERADVLFFTPFPLADGESKCREKNPRIHLTNQLNPSNDFISYRIIISNSIYMLNHVLEFECERASAWNTILVNERFTFSFLFDKIHMYIQFKEENELILFFLSCLFNKHLS